MRCFLPTGNIDGIDLCVAGIEVHLHHFTSHIGWEHFNVLRNTLCVEKLVVGQVITLNKNVMIRKRSSVIATPNIRHSQVMNGTYNAGSPSIKVSMMMKE